MWWTIGWILIAAQFVALEAAAVTNRTPGDTWSEHVWKWFALRDKPRGWQARRITFVAFWTWLTIHFVTGGWV